MALCKMKNYYYLLHRHREMLTEFNAESIISRRQTLAQRADQ